MCLVPQKRFVRPRLTARKLAQLSSGMDHHKLIYIDSEWNVHARHEHIAHITFPSFQLSTADVVTQTAVTNISF